MSLIKQGKKKRSELQLPILHFIAADDWMDKLGESFNVWLKFHTFVDRTDGEREYDKVPMSLEKLFEKLGFSKSKFYRIIKPLWEYGLIDIIEYEDSTRKSQKPKNIVVYEYPFHVIEKKHLPLEKLRDWEKNYNSSSKIAGQTGGRPRKIETLEEVINEGFKNETVGIGDFDGFKNETVDGFKNETVDGFKNETVDGFKNETVTVSEMKPNNVSNNSSNISNNSNNVSINSINDSNSINNDSYKSKDKEEEEDIYYEFLKEYCYMSQFCNTEYQFNQIKKRLIKKGIKSFTSSHVQIAHNKTLDQIYNIGNVDQPHVYFVTVLENEILNDKLFSIKDYEIQKHKRESAEKVKRVPFYNWLEERG